MTSRNKPKTKKRGRKKGQSLLKERVLQVLSTAAQTLDTFGDFTYNPYPYLYASLGMSYRKKSIDNTVRDLTKKGLVEGSKTEGLRITTAGAEIKKRLYRARREKWDAKWRVVIFDIPEKQRKVRDDLRFELKKLGFGPWQKSVWVTPFDIVDELNAYLKQQNLSEAVQIIVGERFGGLNDRDFAAKIWPLKELSEKYTALLKLWEEELKKERGAKERLKIAATLHNRYLDILASDPQLPLELLPTHWVGDDARELFKKLKSILTVGKPF